MQSKSVVKFLKCFLLLVCLMSSIAFFKPKTLSTDKLKMVDELCYVIETNKPFTGISIEKSEEGKLISQASFKKGLLHGQAKSMYPNGKIKSTANFKNGMESGISKGFAENGKLIYEANFTQGKLEGTLTQWREDGTKKREARYKEGLIQWEIHYQDGLPHGLETMWNEKQIPVYQAIYENGKQIEEVIPDPTTTAEAIGFETNSTFGILAE